MQDTPRVQMPGGFQLPFNLWGNSHISKFILEVLRRFPGRALLPVSGYYYEGKRNKNVKKRNEEDDRVARSMGISGECNQCTSEKKSSCVIGGRLFLKNGVCNLENLYLIHLYVYTL